MAQGVIPSVAFGASFCGTCMRAMGRCAGVRGAGVRQGLQPDLSRAHANVPRGHHTARQHAALEGFYVGSCLPLQFADWRKACECR